MKKKAIITLTVFMAITFALVLAGCNNPTGTTNPTSPTEPTNPTGPTGSSTPTMQLPNTVKAVIGYGYDITSHYASSPDIKSAILDLNKLLEAQRVNEDPNLRYGEFETITGKDINEYMKSIAVKVSYSANASLVKVASFSGEIGANFSDQRTSKSVYAFTTSTSRIVKGAYNVSDKTGLDGFFTQAFTSDLETMNAEQLIKKYGTHVMLGAVLGARADYHLSVQKKEQDNITNLGAYAKARAEATYKGVTAGAGSSDEVDLKYKQYFYTETTETKTKVYGGKSEYGQFINDKQEYDKWIESIAGNEIWIDYYPQSLVPLSDLVTDKSRSNAIAQAIETYCKGKEVIMLPVEVGPTSYSENKGSDSNFRIKNGGVSPDWLIKSNFSMEGLRSAGYTKFVFTLNFDTKNELLINVGSRLYASFWKGRGPDANDTTLRYAEKFWTPALSRWESKEFVQEVNLDNFDNELTIRWGTSANADFTVGTRSITIEPKK